MISFKTPLREVVVVNSDAEYQKDIRSLENYILEELNVRTVTITSDEERYGIRYKLLPERRVLGVKFNRDATKIFKALPGRH